MNLRLIDWIWRVRGTLDLGSTRSSAETFDKLDSLFDEENTSYWIEGDTLSFTKSRQRPQDKMSVFDSGTLHVSDGVLRYDMMSKALLACFLAPLLFFAVGHFGVAFDSWRNPPEVAKAKAEAAKKRSLVKAEDVPMNAVDQFLGAPTPEKPKKGGEEIGKRNRKPSMTTAYVFMGIFFALWIIGRVLENYLFRSRIRQQLNESAPTTLDFSGLNRAGIAGGTFD